jgi:hypothetical protein
MREAARRGFDVDEPVLEELTQWVAGSGDGRTSVSRPASVPDAMNTKPLYLLPALAANPRLDPASQATIHLMVKTLQGDQRRDGSWAAWPVTRPPMFGSSNQVATELAVLALSAAASAGDDPARAARDRGMEWLATTQPEDDAQSDALRLILWRRSRRPAEEWRPLVRRIRQRQNGDGGWSQSREMPSDAWATGQALYALAEAGIDADDPSIQRARGFLVGTQRADGSWPMTSRPSEPGGEGAKNLIPITGAGSAWAIMGLLQSGRE